MRHIHSTVKILFFGLIPFLGFGQIDLQTNFEPAIGAPLDARLSIPTLADTSTITFTYPGLITWVVDIAQEWQFTTFWAQKAGAALGCLTVDLTYNDGLSDSDAINAALSTNSCIQIGRSRLDTIDLDIPIYPRDNQRIIIEGYIRNMPGDSVLITGTVEDGDTEIPVADASVFRDGQWIGLVPDTLGEVQGGGTQTRFVGALVKILEINDNTLTVTEVQGYGNAAGDTDYTVANGSYVGRANSMILLDTVDNVTITGRGVVDQNWRNLIDFEATYPILTTRGEDSRGQSGITVWHSDNIRIENVTVKNAGLHNIATFQAYDVLIDNVTLINAHDKNLLGQQSENLAIINSYVKGSLFEDGVSYYSVSDGAKVDNVVIEDCPRHGVWFNTICQGAQISNYTLRNNGFGLTVWGDYAQASNGYIEAGPLSSYMTYFDGAKGLNVSNLTIDGRGETYPIDISLSDSDDSNLSNILIRDSPTGFASLRTDSKRVSFSNILIQDCSKGHELISGADSVLFDRVIFDNVPTLGTQDTTIAQYIACEGLPIPTYLRGVGGGSSGSQTLSFTAPDISISDGNSVDISSVNHWELNGSDHLYYEDGRVGIGTDTPLADLHIEGANMYVINPGGQARVLAGEGFSTGEFGGFKWDYTNNRFQIGANSGTNTISISASDNNVGIGVTNPDRPLEVKGIGGIHFNERTTAERPVDNVEATLEFNEDTNSFETYVVGVGWTRIPYIPVNTGVLDVETGLRINSAATSGNFLRGNGTNFVSSSIQASDITGLFGSGTTGSASQWDGTTLTDFPLSSQTTTIQVEGKDFDLNGEVLKLGQFSAAQATAITPVTGDIIHVTSTDAAFPDIGVYSYNVNRWEYLGERKMWSVYNMSTFTQASPLTLTDEVKVTLPYIATDSIVTYNKGFSQYSSTDTTFNVKWVGGESTVTLRFSAKNVSNITDGQLSFLVGIGGGQGEIESVNVAMNRGTAWSNYTVTFQSFNLATFVANGGKIRVIPKGSNMQIAGPILDANGDGTATQQPMVLYIRNEAY